MWLIVSLIVAGYLLLVQYLRMKRYALIHNKDFEMEWSSIYWFARFPGDRHPAHAVFLRTTAFCEFPFMFNISLEYALFRTYAVPTISSTLQRSGEFDKRPLRRYDAFMCSIFLPAACACCLKARLYSSLIFRDVLLC